MLVLCFIFLDKGYDIGANAYGQLVPGVEVDGFQVKDIEVSGDISVDDPVEISVSLMNGENPDQNVVISGENVYIPELNADWWLLELTPADVLNSFDPETGSMVENLTPYYQGPLVEKTADLLLSLSSLTKGVHLFAFAIDPVMDGAIDGESQYALVTISVERECEDVDADGYYVERGCGTENDCNDGDAAVNPGAEEICGDDIDQDCDGSDLDCDDVDNDGDGYTENQGDCNDNDATIYPGAEEICNDGIDQDCDGSDLDCDNDRDGYTPNQGDCNDNDDTIYPGAEEICSDGIDQDCDGSDLDCDDVDNDGDGYTPNQGDCNDNDATIYPGAEEIFGDGIDQDCNGIDEPGPISKNYWILVDGATYEYTKGLQIKMELGNQYDIDGPVYELAISRDGEHTKSNLARFDENGILWYSGGILDDDSFIINYPEVILSEKYMILKTSIDTPRFDYKWYDPPYSYIGQGKAIYTTEISEEDVVTPAGAFSTYKVVITGSYSHYGGPPTSGISIYWLAECIGPVKVKKFGIEFELKSFNIPFRDEDECEQPTP